MTESSKRHVQRKSHREVFEKREIYAILDEGKVAHVGFNDPDSNEPVVIPVAYARNGDSILIHGSTGSRMFLALKSGIKVCITITLLDGLVAARSANHCSMNYRSVMVFGIPQILEGAEKVSALKKITNSLIPGLWENVREMSKKEEAQTMVLSLALDEISAKKREGDAIDDEDDLNLPTWAGYLPVTSVIGKPITNKNAEHLSVPEYIKDIVR